MHVHRSQISGVDLWCRFLEHVLWGLSKYLLLSIAHMNGLCVQVLVVHCASHWCLLVPLFTHLVNLSRIWTALLPRYYHFTVMAPIVVLVILSACVCVCLPVASCLLMTYVAVLIGFWLINGWMDILQSIGQSNDLSLMLVVEWY